MTRGRGRPPEGIKVQVRLPADTLAAVDEFAVAEGSSRAGAVRDLLASHPALTGPPRRPFERTDEEQATMKAAVEYVRERAQTFTVEDIASPEFGCLREAENGESPRP